MKSKKKHLVIAEKLRKFALRDLEFGVKEWANEKSMLKVCAADFCNYILLCELIKNKKFIDAEKAMWRMDSYSRDKIPDSVYCFIKNKAQA